MADVRDRLPRGRHNLTRAEVAASQRNRMLLAMADTMTEKGYVATTVADVLKAAGVSRETFYQQFSSKLDCFMAAFDVAAGLLVAEVEPNMGGEGDPIQRFDRVLSAYLEALASRPGYARIFLVEVYAAGPEALERRAALQSRIVDTLVELFRIDPLDAERRFACELVVAGIGALVTRPLVAGDLDAVRALRGPVVGLVHRTLAGPAAS